MRHTHHRFAGFWQSVLLGVLLFTGVAPPAAADPTLAWSTYLGGSRNDVGTAVAAWQGNTYVAGTTFSADFPVTGSSSKPGNDETTSDTFVTALDSSGAPIYSTYVSLGEGNETVAGIDVAPDGSAYVAGTASFAGSESAAVVAKLDPWGNVAWKQELRGWIGSIAMAADGQGNVYVLGHDNTDFVGLYFVWRLGPDGSTHYRLDFDRYAWYLNDLAGDASGNVYVSGATELTDLPNPTGPAPDSLNGFVLKISPSGAILWSAYLGGSMVDAAGNVAVASDGSVVVDGVTGSVDLPTLNALEDEPLGTPWDEFLVRLSPSGTPIFSTYLHSVSVQDLAVTASGIHMLVYDDGNDSPLRQPLTSACGSLFIVTLDGNASQLVDGTCLDSFEIPDDMYLPQMAADSTGISLTGPAPSTLPVEDAWQPASAGEGDAFAAKLSAPD